MPPPSFIAKAFVAGFMFGHLFIPTERSWLFRLARPPPFDVPLPTVLYSNAASIRSGSQQSQDLDPRRHLVNDAPPSSLHPTPGSLSVSSTLTPSTHLTPTHPTTNRQPTLSPGIPTLARPNNSDPAAYRPSATQTTVSATLYHAHGVPSASARPPIPVAISPHHGTRPCPSIRFGLAFRSLLCISVLLYHVIPVVCCKWVLKRKAQKLPKRVVSMIIAELQGDTRSLKACSLVSRSWTKESHRHLFHTISLNSRQSADFWFSPDVLSLASHVRSMRLSVETVAGTEHGLCRFPCVKILRIFGWCGSQHLLPTGWSPLNRTVDHLELVRPEGLPHEILTFVSFFASLKSLLITHSHRQSRYEVRATRTVGPGVVSVRFQMLRHLPADGVGPTHPRSGSGTSVRLRESGSLFFTPLC